MDSRERIQVSTGFCLVGAGRIGRIHASNIAANPHSDLKYIVDLNADAAAAVAEPYGAEVTDIDRALSDAAVAAVVIASSTDTHLPFIEAAAKAGKPVLCEKPLDLDAGNARRCLEVAAENGIPLFVGFNRRYDPSFRRIRDAVSSGSIGTVEVLSITSRDPRPPPRDYVRRSGGLFRDMTIHDFDMARWLLPEEPISVFASGSCLIDDAIGTADDVDTAVVVLCTSGGAFCQITNSRRCSYGYDQRIEVFGARGMLRADNDTRTRVEHATDAGFQREPALPFFLERYKAAYRLQIDDFVNAVRGAPHDLASGDDGLRALLLADAAEQSRRHRVVVDLSE